MQPSFEPKEGVSRLTGAWERTSKFGKFYVGKISKDDLQAAIAHLGDVEGYEILASLVTNKKSDNAPDMTFTLRIPFVKDTAVAAAPVAQQATGTNGRGFYNKKK